MRQGAIRIMEGEVDMAQINGPVAMVATPMEITEEIPTEADLDPVDPAKLSVAAAVSVNLLMETRALVAAVMEALMVLVVILIQTVEREDGVTTEIGKTVEGMRTEDGGIKLRMKFLRGLVMKTLNAGASRTECIAEKDQKIISVLMTGSKMISTTG